MTSRKERQKKKQKERDIAGVRRFDAGDKNKKETVKKEPIRATIKAEKKGFDIKKFREKDTIAGKAVKVLTSGKTTAALATVASGLGIAAAGIGAAGVGAAVRGGTATIVRTGFKHRLVTSATTGGKSFVGQGAVTTQRAFVGRTINTAVNKIFHKTRNIATRFGTNTKSTGLTKSILSKIGKGITNPSILIASIGTYPFAGFIKEEALQTLGFAFNNANQNNDIEGMQLAIDDTREILEAAPTIIDRIPFANVVKQLISFFDAAQTKLEVDERVLNKKRGEVEAGETEFQKERRESDEASFERKREFAEEEEERFKGIREDTEERRTEQEDREIKQREFETEFFRLIRQKRFEEAEALSAQFNKELKGGK